MDMTESVVAFMNSDTRKRVSEIPDEAVVITDLLQGDTIIAVPQEDFLEWLMKW